MNSIRFCAVVLTTALMFLSTASLRADDWKTTDGKVYQAVQVIAADPDAITILYKDGGALVPLANLPPDLQKQFNYDPAKAKAAAETRAKDDEANAKALQAELDLLSQMNQAGADSQISDTSDAGPSSAQESDSSSPTMASADTTHHSADELTTSAHSLKSDPAGSTHYSIDDLATSAAAMRWVLGDPAHHTMAHLAYTLHDLGPDPSDTNHHSMSEITDSGL